MRLSIEVKLLILIPMLSSCGWIHFKSNFDYLNGLGTKKLPFKVSSISEFNSINEYCNNNNFCQGKYFVLDHDLDFSNISGSTNIEMIDTFSGSFDGKNHTIENVNLDSSSEGDQLGLFMFLFDAEIKNLHLKNFTINLSQDDSGSVGALAGIVTGAVSYGSHSVTNGTSTIENVTIDNVVITNTGCTTNCNNVGGLLGFIIGAYNSDGLLGTINLTNLSAINLDIDLQTHSLGVGGIWGAIYGTINGADTGNGLSTSIINLSDLTSSGSIKGNDIVGGLGGGILDEFGGGEVSSLNTSNLNSTASLSLTGVQSDPLFVNLL